MFYDLRAESISYRTGKRNKFCLLFLDLLYLSSIFCEIEVSTLKSPDWSGLGSGLGLFGFQSKMTGDNKLNERLLAPRKESPQLSRRVLAHFLG